MSLLITVPCLDTFVSRACLRNISLDPHDVLVIDNTTSNGFAEECRQKGYRIHTEGRNLGVSASWNIGLRTVIDEEIDFLVVMSAAVIALYGLDDLSDNLHDDKNLIHKRLETRFGWHLKPISRLEVLDVGEFDEGFFAYYEDVDWERRAYLAHWRETKGIDVNALDLGPGHAAFHVPLNYEELHRRYLRKWNGPPGEEVYLRPWNLG